MTRLIPKKESLTIEFKSDQNRLRDDELVAASVCLANTEGGQIYLGVENDGSVTGLHPAHQNLTGMTVMIANRTIPPLSVRVEALDIAGHRVARITVPKSRQLVATSDGLLQRRRLMADGSPQCVPFYPHEFTQRQSSLGTLDYATLPVSETAPQDLDPLERERLRQMIERYGGDRALLGLGDEELDGALGLVRREGNRRVPTVAGLLLLGRESVLRENLPTHEVAFQVLQGTQVRVNDFYRTPLLKTFDRIIEQFKARVEEEETQVGLFRVPIPMVDNRSFREAFVNALIHRDYTRLGAVHIRWETEGITVSNPGGFVDGVTLENLLVVEPKPRNPLLADIMKRIGLVERTGRGIDLIFHGLLRYGRPAPNYARSDSTTVVVHLSSTAANVEFLRLILEEERRTEAPIPLDSLIVLAALWRESRLDTTALSRAIQKDESAAQVVLERLITTGLVDANGVKNGGTYTLSQLKQSGGMGLGPGQQEQIVLQYIDRHGSIKRKDVMNLCKIGPHQASRLLRKLTDRELLRKIGERKGTVYVRGS